MAHFRSLWSSLPWLSRVMLVLSVLASTVVATILAFVVYLFIGGYSGGSSPTNVAPVLFPIALLLLVLAGLPCVLVCGLLWAGYSLARRRHFRSANQSTGGTRP